MTHKKILIIALGCIFLSATSAFAAPYTPIVPFFFGIPQEGAAPLHVSFFDRTEGDVSTWRWDFGDGGTSHQIDPTHEYRQPGYYSVTLTVSGPKGTDTLTRLGYIFVSEPKPQERLHTASFVIDNVDETDFILDNRSQQTVTSGEEVEESVIIEESVTVKEVEEQVLDEITPEPTPLPDPPIPGISAEPQMGTAPLRVSFTDTSLGEITERIWLFGNGLSSVITNPTHVYENPGEYMVSLTVIGPGGTARLKEPVKISVTSPWVSPHAQFTAEPTEGMVPLTVQFTDTSTGDVKERIWSFGDKTEAVDPIVEHTYTKAGTYPVSLIVTGYDGATDRIGGFITVLPLPDPPAPKIECSTIGALEITCNTTISQGSDDVSWSWDFGDGNKSTEAEPAHIYKAFGVYVISVTVTDAYGQTGSSAIGLALNLPSLNATLTHEIDTHDPMKVIFTGIGEAETWKWDFGDGESGAGQVVTHTYKMPGERTVTLTIADPYQQKEVTEIVTISAPSLDATGTHEIDKQDPMTVTGVGDAEREFGDGAKETGQIATHTYNMTGEMSVTLTDTYQQKEVQPVTMYAPPIDVDFAITLSDAYQYTVTFFDRSYGPIATWQWYFGDGAASKEQNPVHSYGSAGEYTVQLIITSEYGETKMQQVRFIIPESASVSDERLKLQTLSEPDLDISRNEPVIDQTVISQPETNQTVIKSVKQMADITEI